MTALPLAQVAATSPCDACLSGCCRGFNLVIQGFDAWRIGRDLKLPLGDFAELRWTDKPVEGVPLSLDPAHRDRAYRLLLKRVPDVLGGFTVRCVFLVTVGTRGRCGIYGSRPSMCRTYPTSFTGGLLAASSGRFCPPGAWSLESLDGPHFRAQQLFRQRFVAVDDRLALAWNARVVPAGVRRSPEEYLRFLSLAFSELERRRPEWLVEPGPGEPERPEAGELAAGMDRVLGDLGWPVPEAAKAG